MKNKTKKPAWPAEYEAPRLLHVKTAFEQALGVTQCSLGNTASGGTGSCTLGSTASGTPTEPNACMSGYQATIGPGSGNSPCGPGFQAKA